jgi:hypothetical protein
VGQNSEQDTGIVERNHTMLEPGDLLRMRIL